jgi:tRNA pseudouridine38-40 synthase
MARYFLEVAYNGTNYSGFQIQQNANTIQGEVEKALQILLRIPPPIFGDIEKGLLTGSSRTDAGVHALQNFFHFDYNTEIVPSFIYKINALLPADIAVKRILLVPDNAHARFDAIAREYEYRIYKFKNPFQYGVGYYYPYKMNLDLLHHATSFILSQKNFFAFTKTNTDVKHFGCTIYKCEWKAKNDKLIFTIQANRFLRGMVRLLTASLLQVARTKMPIEHFYSLFNSTEKCGVSVPAQGLTLTRVIYKDFEK